MIHMARSETKDGKLQGNSLPEIRAGMKLAAVRLAPGIKRKGRPLEEGPILSRLAAWYLLQSHERQAEILAEGHRIIETLKEIDPGPISVDDAFAAELRRRLAEAGTPLADGGGAKKAGSTPAFLAEREYSTDPDRTPAEKGLADTPAGPQSRVKRRR